MKLNYTRSLIQCLLEKPKDFEWSAQGLGMMRLYVKKPELRLHIWDSSLKVPSVSPLHTHPWDFGSTVIAGVMWNRRYSETTDERKGERFRKVEITCGEKACTHSEPVETRLMELPSERYVEGATYFQKFNEIHVSAPEDGTITLVERCIPEGNSPDNAFIFWRGKGPWVDAKPRPALHEEVVAVTQRALETWFL